MLRLFALLALVAAPSLSAQPVFDTGRLDALFDRPPSVEVNLRGSLLRLAAAATADEEPELAAMIQSLDAVTVRIYGLASARSGLDAELSRLSAGLESEGWYTMVRVRATEPVFVDEDDDPDDEQDVWVYVRDRDDAFGGLALVAVNHTEQNATFVHIDGLIDPAQIGRLSSRFGGVNVRLGTDD